MALLLVAIDGELFYSPPALVEQPRRALLALDFSESSLRAAKVAFQLLARPARVFMVSADDPAPHIDLLFDSVEHILGMDRDVTVSRHSVAGDATALLQLAVSQSIDIVSMGRSYLRRVRPSEHNEMWK